VFWGHSSPALPNPYQFGGKEYYADFGLELSDFGFRQYDPWVGRFTGVDPLADAPANSIYSPYHYVWNNPLRYVDPDGRHGESVTDDYGINRKGKISLLRRTGGFSLEQLSFDYHSHPGGPSKTGDVASDGYGDQGAASRQVTKLLNSKVPYDQLPRYFIYRPHVPQQYRFEYSPWKNKFNSKKVNSWKDL
jgi:RHS repeat-associated protein